MNYSNLMPQNSQEIDYNNYNLSIEGTKIVILDENQNKINTIGKKDFIKSVIINNNTYVDNQNQSSSLNSIESKNNENYSLNIKGDNLVIFDKLNNVVNKIELKNLIQNNKEIDISNFINKMKNFCTEITERFPTIISCFGIFVGYMFNKKVISFHRTYNEERAIISYGVPILLLSSAIITQNIYSYYKTKKSSKFSSFLCGGIIIGMPLSLYYQEKSWFHLLY